ncbi:MAG: SUMF1/EgtB/PvdO family nonheme iron enzyme [Deltaproteobacteria bacterium]|nr:SUMF1/EgtB/PvdO family nonheme iron enzyme [Deltaproteobacteria bacterium]
MSRGRFTTRSAALAVAFVMICALSAAADYEAGKRAWDAGKPAEALAQWRGAADAGDRRAMLALGRLYLKGLGAPQDYVLAHMWFNLAASRGEMAALKERDALAAKMTPQQVAAAQDQARAWRPGGGRPTPASAERPAPAPPQPAAGQPPARAIREAQELLTALGYEPGTADGKWGGRSAKAYTAFLRDAGLPPGDTLTPEGLRAMRGVAKRQGAGTVPGAGARAKRQQPVALRPRPEALHRAAKAGDVDGLKAALKAGMDVNARDRRGWTALMHAANKGYKLMVGPLLEAKADPDVQAADGATALFMASVHGHSEIVELLMKAGADVSIKGPKGKTALDVALARRDSTSLRAFVFSDCPECPEMVVVPGGSYKMGSPGDEAERSSAEGPQHRVTMPRPIAVGKYEVTFAEWDECVAGGGCNGYRPGDAGWGRGRRPVINVSWEDAKSYVEWLSQKTGKGYRLLSESEWEYMARAGTVEPFHLGGTISTDQANYDGDYTYGTGRKGVDRGKTVSVGSFPANGFGLHDVHGNVWEWVEDCWHGNYDGAPADGSAWTSGGDCGSRVLRGGSWVNDPRNLRSANRNWFTAGNWSDSIGFRIARTLTP